MDDILQEKLTKMEVDIENLRELIPKLSQPMLRRMNSDSIIFEDEELFPIERFTELESFNAKLNRDKEFREKLV